MGALQLGALMAEVVQQKRWIWPFELLEKIGEGGMGIVYRARFVKNDRQVAVKLLPPDLDREVVKARFTRELEILKDLSHPNIVTCFGGMAKGNQLFYAMELVEGGTLEDLLDQRHKLSWGEVISLGIPMCKGLAYAHDRGVIHRDIKPGNFLLTNNGQPKLADFGLATVAAASRLTMAGKTLGTLRYMSPEQIRGKDLSPQSDLYSLGCVLFQMLTGAPPFDGESAAEIMQAHLKNVVPRIRADVPDCPKQLEDLITDLLSKSAEDRPKSALEVAARLEEAPQITIAPSPEALSAQRSAEATAPVRAALRMEASTGTIPAWFTAAGLIAVLVLMCSVAFLFEKRKVTAESIEFLETHYKDTNRAMTGTKFAAAEGLGRIAQRETHLVEMFREDLSSDDPIQRQAAAIAIGASGRAGKSAGVELFKVQKDDPDPTVRNEAARAEMRIKNSGPINSPTWPYWTSILVVLACAIWLMIRGALPAPAFLRRFSKPPPRAESSPQDF